MLGAVVSMLALPSPAAASDHGRERRGRIAIAGEQPVDGVSGAFTPLGCDSDGRCNTAATAGSSFTGVLNGTSIGSLAAVARRHRRVPGMVRCGRS